METESRKKQFLIMAMLLILGITVLGFGFKLILGMSFKDTQRKETNQILQLSSQEYTIEYGSELPNFEKFVLNDSNKDSLEIDTGKLKNEIGTYNINFKSIVLGKEYSNTLKFVIKDTTPPEVKLNSLVIKEGETKSPLDFVREYHDLQTVVFNFKDNPDFKKLGTSKITIVATDESGNTSENVTELQIIKKEEPPQSLPTNPNSNAVTSKPENNETTPQQQTRPNNNTQSNTKNGVSKTFHIDSYESFDEVLKACQLERENQFKSGVTQRGSCTPFKDDKGINKGYRLDWN